MMCFYGFHKQEALSQSSSHQEATTAGRRGRETGSDCQVPPKVPPLYKPFTGAFYQFEGGAKSIEFQIINHLASRPAINHIFSDHLSFYFPPGLVFFFLPASVQVSVTPRAPPPPPVPPPAELFQRFKMSPFVFCGHQDSDAFCFQPLHFISPNKR